MPKTLLGLYGNAAVEFLVSEVQKERKIYSTQVDLSDDVSVLSRRGLTDWLKVVEAVKTRFGGQATSDLCWQSWRRIRYRFMAGHETSSDRLKHQLLFLNEFRNKRAAALQATPLKRAPLKAKKEKALAYEYGDEIIKIMLTEIAKHPCFHGRAYMKRTESPDEMRSEDRRAWNQVMKKVKKAFPTAPSSAVWKTWRNFRIWHNTHRASKKWISYLHFLDCNETQSSALPGTSNSEPAPNPAEHHNDRASSTSSIVVLEPEPPTYETYFQSVSFAPSLLNVSVPQTPPSNDSFKAMLKLIHGKIRKKRNSEAALNAVRRAALKIIADLHLTNDRTDHH